MRKSNIGSISTFLRKRLVGSFFFENHGIVPLRITYEELDNDILATVKRIARHVGVRESKVVPIERVSRFERIRDERNTAWARRFRLERQLPEYGR